MRNRKTFFAHTDVVPESILSILDTYWSVVGLYLMYFEDAISPPMRLPGKPSRPFQYSVITGINVELMMKGINLESKPNYCHSVWWTPIIWWKNGLEEMASTGQGRHIHNCIHTNHLRWVVAIATIAKAVTLAVANLSHANTATSDDFARTGVSNNQVWQ